MSNNFKLSFLPFFLGAAALLGGGFALNSSPDAPEVQSGNEPDATPPSSPYYQDPCDPKGSSGGAPVSVEGSGRHDLETLLCKPPTVESGYSGSSLVADDPCPSPPPKKDEETEEDLGPGGGGTAGFPGPSVWSSPAHRVDPLGGGPDDGSAPPTGSGALDSPFVGVESGSLTQIRIDLSLPGGVGGLSLGRVYRSSLLGYNGIIGNGWELNVLKRIRPVEPLAGGPDEFWIQEGDGLGSGIFYPDSSAPDWYFSSDRPDQFKFQAATGSTPQQIIHYTIDGSQEVYSQFGSPGAFYYLTRSEDMWGNGFSLEYSDSISHEATPWTLTLITDDLGREFSFAYDSGNGRLDKVEVKVSGNVLFGVDYTYEAQTDGTVLLTKVERDGVAMEDANGNLTMGKYIESYAYKNESNEWRLQDVINGVGEKVVSWEYYNGGVDNGKVWKQTDRYGGTKRAPGVHTYVYTTPSGAGTVYTGPDGDTRTFFLDSDGRISSRVENPTGSTTSTTSYAYEPSGCTSCSRLKRITFPDDSYETYQYDDFDNLTAQWWYPATGSSLPPRVERWLWSSFDPSIGEDRIRLLEHELRRDASAADDPDEHTHPSDGVLNNVDGHHVHLYTWTADELSLEAIDYGSIQTSSGGGGSSIYRTATFSYFADGRLKTATEFANGNQVSHHKYTLDTATGAYINSYTFEDSMNATASDTSWTTTKTRVPGSYYPLTKTAADGTVTEFTTTVSGLVYQIHENSTGTGTSRLTDLRFDAAGRLVKSKTTAGGLTETVVLRLDESGVPYEIEKTGTQGGVQLTKFTFSVGDKLTMTEDWRGWKYETEYGVGSLRLPVKKKEHFGGQTRTVWQAGDGGSDSGYDSVGRLTSWRNVAGWKSYRTYNARGGLKYAFQQTDATNYAAEAYFYDARGYVEEKEVGSLNGSPLNPSPSGLTWLEHIVYSRNVMGYLLARNVYEGGDTAISSRTRFTVDSRGRTVSKETFMGDRSDAVNATPVQREYDYDALNRPLQIRSMASSGGTTAIRVINATYNATAKLNTFTEVLPSGASKTMALESDALGRTIKRTQTASGITRSWDYEFDGFDRRTAAEDPFGKRTDWTGDDFGHLLTETITPSAGSGVKTTTYTYDSADGALLSATDAMGKTTNYATMDWLRPWKVTYPDSRVFEITAYDDLGRRTQTLDARGVQHNYTYDYIYLTEDLVVKPSGGLVTGPSRLTWEYDRARGKLQKSTVWSGTTALWETAFTHNDLGEKTAETQGIGADAMTWGWEYGFAGELIEATYPAVAGIETGVFGYGLAGRMTGIEYKEGATTLANDALIYDGYRVTKRADVISGIDTNFGYDSIGRLTHLDWSKDVGGAATMLDGQDRAFDLTSRVTSRQRVLDTKGDVFVHDGYGRMKEWYQGVTAANSNTANTVPSTWEDVERYSLNAVYGRNSVESQEFGGSASTTNYASDSIHFYTSVDTGSTPVRTHQDGRLNSDGTFYYRWDAWGRLSEVDKLIGAVPTLIRRHHYDAEGRRVRTEEIEPGVGTTVKRLVYWGARLALTYTESANKDDMRTYGYAGGADGESFVVMTNSVSPLVDGSFALARDFQGSILALIDRSTKNVVERYRYGAFGRVSIEDASGTSLTESAYGNDRFFLGKPFDAEIGIYDLRARWYDAASGSFLSPDPLGAVDSWNMYQYGFGTPGTWMDPFGLNIRLEFGDVYFSLHMRISVDTYDDEGNVTGSEEYSFGQVPRADGGRGYDNDMIGTYGQDHSSQHLDPPSDSDVGQGWVYKDGRARTGLKFELETTQEEDEKAMERLEKAVGHRMKFHKFAYNCRNWSRAVFSELFVEIMVGRHGAWPIPPTPQEESVDEAIENAPNVGSVARYY